MRFAIYYAPEPSSLLHQLGSQWLGRDAFSGGACVQPSETDLAEITAEPRRYGFHATLKPPFALADRSSPAVLEGAVEILAGSLRPIEIVPVLRQIDGFLALVPAETCEELEKLAAACVRDLDGFRQPASENELARRRQAGLSPRQGEHLERWGYPYVFDEFRFHMTLSRRLSLSEMDEFAPLAETHFNVILGRPLIIDALTLFWETYKGAPFEVHRRFPLPMSRAKAAS